MKLQTFRSRLLTTVALTLFAFSIQNGLSAGILQNGNQKYEQNKDVPPPVPKEKDRKYRQGVPEAKQAQFNKGPLYYDKSSRSYNIWQKPHEADWTARERCQPRPFCPRGYGDLGNKPRTCYRLDYHRYVVKDLKTTHGPSYYRWSTKPERCCELKKNGCGCNHCRSKKRFRLFR